MEKIDILKYIALLLCFIVLFLPSTNDAWIWVIVLAGICLFIWLFKVYGKLDIFKYSAIMFGVLTLIADMGSIEQKWFIWLGVISLLIWSLKKWVFK